MTPDEHTPDDILAALRMGVDYTFTIKVRSLELAVRPLAVSEVVRLTADAREQLSKLPPEGQTEMIWNVLLAKGYLRYATKPDVGSKVEPRLTDYVLDRMTNDELSALFRAYLDGVELLNPAVETIGEQQLAELVEAAKKNSVSQLTAWSRWRLATVLSKLINGG